MIHLEEFYIFVEVECITALVILVLAQIDNHLLGAGVEHVEEFAVLGVEAARRKVVDASQAVNQFPAQVDKLLLEKS